MGATPHQRSRVPGLIDARAKTAASVLAIPGLVCAYDANEIPLLDGSTISEVRDLSGNGHHLFRTATGPIFDADGAANGKAKMVFTSKNTLQATSRVVPLTEVSVYLVADWANSGRPFGLENAGSGTHGLALYPAGFVIRNNNVAGDITPSGTYTGTTLVYLLTIGASAGSVAYINGTSRGTGANTAYSDASVNLNLGGAGTADNIMTGSISEFGAFDHVLTSDERTSLFDVLMDKYGL